MARILFPLLAIVAALITSSPLAVGQPADPAEASEPAAPNPTLEGRTLNYSLPSGEPASIELPCEGTALLETERLRDL